MGFGELIFLALDIVHPMGAQLLITLIAIYQSIAEGDISSLRLQQYTAYS